MTSYPKLSKPPIIEALVDIQMQPVATISVATLKKSLPNTLTSQFPKIEEIKKFESSITPGPQGPQVSSKDLGAYGLMLRNEQNTKAVQVRVDGFALSHLQPYDSFDTLKAEAVSLWSDYKKLIGSDENILRVALRYINVIDCHRTLTSTKELDGYLKNIPQLPKGAGSELTGFGLELVSQDSKQAIVTTVRRGLLKNLQTLQHGISVDIEVVKQFAKSPSQDELWTSIEALRPIKNAIFFDVVSENKIEEYR